MFFAFKVEVHVIENLMLGFNQGVKEIGGSSFSKKNTKESRDTILTWIRSHGVAQPLL